MADFYYGDPYLLPEGHGGWIEADSDEDPVEDALVQEADADSSGDSSDSDEEPMEVTDSDEDSEEEPVQIPEEPVEMQQEPAEAQDEVADVEQQVDQMLDEFEEVDVEPDLTDPESDIEDPRYRIRSRDEPLPPPSHQVYRHPGGPLWKHTPRKSVPAVRRRDALSFTLPMQGPTVGHPGAGTSAAGALGAAVSPFARASSDIVRNMARIDAQAYTTARQMIDMGADIQVSGARVRRLDVEVYEQSRTIERMRTDLTASRDEVAQLQAQLAETSQTAQEAVRVAQQALDDVETFRQRVAAFLQLP